MPKPKSKATVEEVQRLEGRLREADQAAAMNEYLVERLAELELAIEDRDWMSLSYTQDRELSRDGLRKIMALARIYYLKNPLINRAVSVQAHYVWGQGINIQARDPKVNAVVQAFLDDLKNKAELTSHQAQTQKEIDLQIFGNIFFVFFPNVSTGQVRVRSIPVDEVADIITDPDDAKTPWYYKRAWNVRRLDEESGTVDVQSQTAYYPDWQYNPATKPETIGGYPVKWDMPVYHVKVGGLSDMRFGVSEVYVAIDWARAYKEFLEDWATLVRAYSRFAWHLTTKGGSKGVAAAKAKLGTTVGVGNYEANPPAVTGSTFVAGEGVSLTPIKTAGATTSAEDGRRILLMVAAAMGLPESFFGDVSVGTLATAKSLDRPTELKMRDRQTFWRDIFLAIVNYVIDWAARAENGPLPKELLAGNDGGEVALNKANNPRGKIDRHVDVSFPDILERDVGARISAIVAAATLNGNPSIGTLDDRTLTRLILQSLGVDQIDEVLDKISPEGKDSLMAQRQQQKDAQAQVMADRQVQTKANQGDEQQQAAEAAFIEAVQDLRESVKELLARRAVA